MKSNNNNKDTSSAFRIARRRIVPGCEPIFCWGTANGREWVVVGSNDGRVSILCNGASGPTNYCKGYQLWQTLSLKQSVNEIDEDFDEDENIENIRNNKNEHNPWKITALAWCKPPALKIADHPLDPDAPYCACFAVGSHGRVSLFYPSDKERFTWRIISVLRPAGEVNALCWAPESHHLVSGGTQLVLWTPDSHSQTLCADQISVPSNASTIGGGTAAKTDKNRLLMSRSPMMASILNSDKNSLQPSGSSSVGSVSGNAFDASWIMDCQDQHVHCVDFSADGRLFASVAKKSKMLRVWFEGRSYLGDMDYVLLPHPSPIRMIEWRTRACGSLHHIHSSDYPQSIVSLSEDGVIRVWQESDPQIDAMQFTPIVKLDTSGFESPCISIGWLRFINFFEGLRSPYPEHNSYVMSREDFKWGFSTGSRFFNDTSHVAAQWGNHQKGAVELLTGSGIQDNRSSLDWLVCVCGDGKVAAWSIEGLSDSPGRAIYTNTWNMGVVSLFDPSEHGQAKQKAHGFLSRSSESKDACLANFNDSVDACELIHVPHLSTLIATCRVTQMFDPHNTVDLWPSTSVYDLSPHSIEVLHMSERGLIYSFAESNEKTESPFGSLTYSTLAISRGHLDEIVYMTHERVIGEQSLNSLLEENYWVSTIDMSGFGMGWPVRAGGATETIDDEALSRRRAVALPCSALDTFAICTQFSDALLGAIVVSDDEIKVYSHPISLSADAIVTDGWSRVNQTPLEHRTIDMALLRDSQYQITVVLQAESHVFVYHVSSSEIKLATSYSLEDNIMICPVSCAYLYRQDYVCIGISKSGVATLFDKHGSTAQLSLRSENAGGIKRISNSTSGAITLSGSSIIEIFVPGLKNGEYNLSGVVDLMNFMPASVDCDISVTSILHLGADMDLLGVGVLQKHLDETGLVTSIQPNLLIFSKQRAGARSLFHKHASRGKYELICSSGSKLPVGKHIRGIVWSGRDFGLAIAIGGELHMFQGWHFIIDEKAVERLRANMEYKKSTSVIFSKTQQLEAANSIGDAAVGMQMPLEFHRPAALMEFLRMGWGSVVRAVIGKISDALEEHRNYLNDYFENESEIPAKDFIVKVPYLTPREILTGLKDALKPSIPACTVMTGAKKDTAAALFADDDYEPTFGGNKRNAGRGAASALFDDDDDDTWTPRPTAFTVTEAPPPKNVIAECLLSSYRVAGLDPSEQLQLVAISSVFMEIYGSGDSVNSGLDDAGSKFLLVFKLFQVASKSLAVGERPIAMRTADLLWAFHSDSQDALVAKCLTAGDSTWADASKIGLGLWIRSSTHARQVAEDIAKAQYKQSEQDPFACAMLYFAVGKASVVSGLFRLAKNVKAAELLANDFKEERWQTAAVKNAYSLVNQMRYRDAASFFILGGKLHEATNILIRHLHDYQLALFVCLLVEGDSGPVRESILRNVVLSLAVHSQDKWLSSLVYSTLGDHENSLLVFSSKTSLMSKDVAKSSNQSAEQLDLLQEKGLPVLTSEFNSLESTYIKYLLDSPKPQLARIRDSCEGLEILTESTQRATNYLGSIGVPTVALYIVSSCYTSSKSWSSLSGLLGIKLASQSFYATVLRYHAVKETEEQYQTILSKADIEELKSNLARALDELGGDINVHDVLTTLWRISRSSQHVFAEFTILRMLGITDRSFLQRLQQTMRSIMVSVLAIGQNRLDASPQSERRQLPARRLAAYSIFFMDLSGKPENIISECGFNSGTNTDVLVVLFETYARVALFAAAFAKRDYDLLKKLLESDSSILKLRGEAFRIAKTYFDYEELLIKDDFVDQDNYNEANDDDEDEDLSQWGLTYSTKLLRVIVFRKLLCWLRDQQSTISCIPSFGNAATMSKQYIDEFLDHVLPVNWALMSDLHVTSLPIGCGALGKARLEAMKWRAFNNDAQHALWVAVTGREHLKILDAASKWTSRSMDQERVKMGYFPDTEAFCGENSKVLFKSGDSSMLLSIDYLRGTETTVLYGDERGAHLLKYAISDDSPERDVVSDDDESRNNKALHDDDDDNEALRTSRSTSLAPPTFTRTESMAIKDPHRGLVRANSLGDLTECAKLREGEIHESTSPRDTLKAARRKTWAKSMKRLTKKASSAIIHQKDKETQHKPSTTIQSTHRWTAEMKKLLLVSTETDRLWWDPALHVPLNRNLYVNSYQHFDATHMELHRQYSAAAMTSDATTTFQQAQRTKKVSRRPHLLPKFLSSSFSKKNVTESSHKTVMSVKSHPFLPIYATGEFDGSVKIWSAEPATMTAWLRRPSVDTWKAGYTTRVRFTEDGTKLANCDSAGQLSIWDVSMSEPSVYMQCHSKRCMDLSILDFQGRIVATAGQSSHSENLAIWDFSLPPSSRKIASMIFAQGSAAYSLACLEDQRCLIVGGGNGQIGVYDLRQRMMIIEEEDVHAKAVRCLSVHPSHGHYLASGSTDGSIKLLSWRGGALVTYTHLIGVHPTHTLVSNATSDSMISQRGVTDISLSPDFLYSCGADGTAKATPLSLMMI